MNDTQGSAKRINPWVIVAAVVVIVLIVGAGLAYRTVSQRRDASAKLQQAIDLVEKADATVVDIDAVISEEVTAALAERAREASAQIPAAVDDLDRAIELLDGVTPELSDEQAEQAVLLKAAAESRLEMLSYAPEIIALNVKASEAMPLAESAWEATLAADKSSDAAVASYNKLTKAGVTESQRLNKQAGSQLASATALFSEAEAKFPEAGLGVYRAYVSARTELNKLSQESDAAWLGNNPLKANEIIIRYNAADKKAVELAKTLPASPRQAIATAYENGAKAPTESYYAARDKATAADEKLRAF